MGTNMDGCRYCHTKCSKSKGKDKYHLTLLTCGIYNMTQRNLFTKDTLTHRHGEQTCGCQGEEGWGEKGGEFGAGRYKLSYTGWIDKNFQLWSTGIYVKCSENPK